MNGRTPDQHTLLDAIALANRAPSVHNTQPWRWRLDAGAIQLRADPTRRLPATDLDGRDLLLSCGAALHHLRVALGSLGWLAAVRYLPDPTDPALLATLTTTSQTPSEEDTTLAGAITRRRTDRRRFSSWPVPDQHLDVMVERAANSGALLIPVTDPFTRSRLARAIDQAACYQPDDLAYDMELTAWTGRGPAAVDGVLAASTPPVPQTHDDTTMRTFAPGTLAEAETGRDEPDGGRLLVLATAADDRESVLRAGEAASAALLTATEVGLATCPLSQALEVPSTRALIRDQVLDAAAYPHLVLRIGWAPTAAPPPPWSPRRPATDTVDLPPG
jgi:nitroreductase